MSHSKSEKEKIKAALFVLSESRQSDPVAILLLQEVHLELCRRVVTRCSQDPNFKNQWTQYITEKYLGKNRACVKGKWLFRGLWPCSNNIQKAQLIAESWVDGNVRGGFSDLDPSLVIVMGKHLLQVQRLLNSDSKRLFNRQIWVNRISNPFIISVVFLSFLLGLAWHQKSLDLVHGSHLNYNERVFANDARLVFRGWAEPESTYRWSNSPQARIFFKMIPSKETVKGRLSISLKALGDQKIKLFLNDTPIFSNVVSPSPALIDIKIDPALIKTEGQFNKLSFLLPDARCPGNGDVRLLGVLLEHLSIF